MDCQILIFWENDIGLVYSGSITSVREVKAGVWDGSEYIIPDGMNNPNHIMVFVTGVPITNYLTLAYALERWSAGAEPLSWNVKQDSVTAEEQASILARRYITVTWERFKALVTNAADEPFSDSDLLVGYE